MLQATRLQRRHSAEEPLCVHTHTRSSSLLYSKVSEKGDLYLTSHRSPCQSHSNGPDIQLYIFPPFVMLFSPQMVPEIRLLPKLFIPARTPINMSQVHSQASKFAKYQEAWQRGLAACMLGIFPFPCHVYIDAASNSNSNVFHYHAATFPCLFQ